MDSLGDVITFAVWDGQKASNASALIIKVTDADITVLCENGQIYERRNQTFRSHRVWDAIDLMDKSMRELTYKVERHVLYGCD